MSLRLSLFSKVLIVVSVAFLSQLAIYLFIADLQRQSTEANFWYGHTKEALKDAETTLVSLVDAQTAVRGFVLTDDHSFVEQYREAKQKLPGVVNELNEKVRDNPAQQARLADISKDISAWLVWSTENVRLTEVGNKDAVIARFKSLNGMKQVDHIRKQIADFELAEEQLLVERAEQLENTGRRLRMVILLGAGGTFLGTVLLAFAFNQGIVRRVNVIAENARRFVEQKELLPTVAGSDEVTLLDAQFREMALAIVNSRAATENQNRVLQSVLDSLGDGVVVADETGKFTIFNPAAERILRSGKSESAPDEWTSRYALYLPDRKTPFPPEEIPLARAIRGESVNDVEIYIKHHDMVQGAWISVTGRPLIDSSGAHRGGVVVFHDTTDQKDAEESLRRAAEEIRDLYNKAPCGYHSLSDDGTVISLNDTELDWLGYSRQEIVFRKKFTDLLTVEGSRIFEDTFPGFKQHGAVSNLEFDIVRKDKSILPVILNAVAIKDDAGNYVSSRSTMVDITERKRLETELRKANEELEHRVEARTAELAQTNRELTEKNRENEMFVYSVSHDLRSPLVNLQGFSKELTFSCEQLRALVNQDFFTNESRKTAVELLDTEMAESVSFITSGVTRLSNIIDALLRLSRAGRVEFQWQTVDVATIVKRVVESLNATIVEKQAVVNVGELLPVVGDSTALETVFANLIGNALNYLDSNRPGIIEVGMIQLSDVSNSLPASCQTYFVRDNGLGILDAYQHKIFQAFQRLHPTVAKGEGMGLAIVRRVVERHGGRVWIESVAGKGSTFFVSIPTTGSMV